MTDATSTASRPTAHASLSDGTTTIGIKFIDNRRNPDPLGFRALPYPRTALKTTQGESKYSDLEPPYFAIAQDDFTGGRGNEDFEDDTSRFYDTWRCDTTKESGVILGGRENYTTGYRNMDMELPGSVEWNTIYGNNQYIANKFIASASYTVKNVEIWVKRVGDPGTLTVELWDDSAGEPNAVQATKGLAADSVTTDTLSVFRMFTFGVGYAITASTDYWIVIYGAGTDDATDHWMIGCDTDESGKKSSDGSSWSAASYGAYFRGTIAVDPFVGKFFEYKRGLYMVTQDYDGTNSALYINGDRGAADANTGALSTLVDASKSATWVADEWIGCYVLLTKGPGSTEQQPWRKITDSSTTTLTVSPDWEITHTTSTEYVILGSDKWTELVAAATLGQYVTDVAVGGEYIWLACGGDSGDNGIIRYRYYNSGGTWTAESYTTANGYISDKVLMINDPAEGETLWSSTTGETYNDTAIYKGLIGKDKYSGFNLHYPVTQFNTSIPWEDKIVANVTQSLSSGHTKISVATGHTTGIAAVLNLDTPIDFTVVDDLVAEIKSSTTLAAGDYQFVYDDVYNLAEYSQPSAVYHLDETGDSPAYTPLPYVYEGNALNTETLTIETDDRLLICYSKPFNAAYVSVGGTPNDVAAVLSVTYYNGRNATAVSGLSDGTDVSGDSFKQDGNITWTMPEDWEEQTINSVTGYWVIFKWDATLTTSMILDRIYVTRASNIAVNIPALTANEWTTVACSLADPNYYPDETSIKSIGLNVATDKGGTNIEIRNLWLSNDPVSNFRGHRTIIRLSSDTTFNLPETGRVNGLQAYAGNVDDPILNPWILTEDGVYEVQTQNDDQIVALPLGEVGTLASPDNGQGHCVNGTYLYFNIGEKIERYYNRTLDDVGPDRDSGLPDDRPGIPRSMASYPGRIYAGIDAGAGGTSSVLTLKGTSWHEVYRAPRSGNRIRNIFIQAIPGSNVDRLWISMASDVLWVPISLNPYFETDYTYTHEGTLTTSWIYANLLDVQKLWKSLKVFAENVGANYYVEVDYQTDTSSTWTEIGTFDTAPLEEIDIASTLPQARRIRYRLRLQSNDVDETPRVKAIVTEGVAFVPVKYQIAFTFELADGRDVVDLLGIKETTADLSTEEKYDKFVDWANTGQPLTLRMNWPMHDNKTVFIDPLTIQPLQFTPKGTSGNTAGREIHAAQLTTIEV